MTGSHNRFSLTNEQLKIIAVVTMTIDHIGAYLLPQYDILRVVGRISFPIFAFMVGQGCIHTRNIKKYFVRMTGFALATQVVLLPFRSFYDLNIMFTFALSIAVITAVKKAAAIKNTQGMYRAYIFVLPAISVAAVYIICSSVDVEYGFWGCMIAVFVFAAHHSTSQKDFAADNAVQTMALAVGLLVLSVSSYQIQFYSLWSLPLILLYNGRKTGNTGKNFFYIYYPLHLVIIHIFNILL